MKKCALCNRPMQENEGCLASPKGVTLKFYVCGKRHRRIFLREWKNTQGPTMMPLFPT